MRKSTPDRSANELRTADLSLAAFLKTAGFDLLRTEREDRRVYFIFERTPTLEGLKLAYFNHTDDSRVPALEFSNQLAALKTLTHTTA